LAERTQTRKVNHFKGSILTVAIAKKERREEAERQNKAMARNANEISAGRRRRAGGNFGRTSQLG
jgi:hypothetical protein